MDRVKRAKLRVKFAKAYYKRADELANTVNVGNGARLRAVEHGNINDPDPDHYEVDLQIVGPANIRAHMAVKFTVDKHGRPIVELASGETAKNYRKPQPGNPGYNYGYGSIIRALALQIAQDVGAYKTIQMAVNVQGLLKNQPGAMPISGRIMKNLGAKMTSSWSSGNSLAATFEVKHANPIRSKLVLKKKKVIIPSLPPKVDYGRQFRKLEKGLRLIYNGNSLSYNSTLLTFPFLQQLLNRTLNTMKLRELKTKINVMQRRVPNKTKLYSMKKLVDYYAGTLKRFQLERAAAVSILKKRLAGRIAKPRARSAFISPQALTAVRMAYNLSNIPRNTAASNLIRIAKSRNVPGALIELELKKRGLPVNPANLYTPQQLANRAKNKNWDAGLYFKTNNGVFNANARRININVSNLENASNWDIKNNPNHSKIANRFENAYMKRPEYMNNYNRNNSITYRVMRRRNN